MNWPTLWRLLVSKTNQAIVVIGRAVFIAVLFNFLLRLFWWDCYIFAPMYIDILRAWLWTLVLIGLWIAFEIYEDRHPMY
jgi:hypothetical protein